MSIVDLISWRARKLFISCCVVAVGSLGALHAGEWQHPADPLTEAERVLAADVALKSQAEARMFRDARLEDKTTVVATMLAPRTTMDGRKAIVFLRSGTTSAVQVLIDLASQKAEAWRDLPVNSIPLTPDDVADALKIAAADSQVRALLPTIETFATTATTADARVAEGIRSIGGGRSDPCNRDRCVALLFRQGSRYITNVNVTVNLTTRRVQTAVRNAR